MKLTKQLRIFLLYARGNQEAVVRLHRRLVREGADVWLDQEKILPGQDWQYEIHQAIYNSDLVIACISRQFNKQGGYRHEELKIALQRARSFPEGKVFLIPVHLEPCDMAEPLRRWQRVDLFERRGVERLLRVLKQQAGS